MKSFFETRIQANKERLRRISEKPYGEIQVFNLKKTHPRRKLKYFIGSYMEWLNL